MADKVFKGTIAEFFEREWTDPSSGDDMVLHSFKLDNEKRFFRTGTQRLKHKVGTAIKFVANGKGNVNLASVEEIEASEAPPPRKAASSGGGFKGGARDTYWEDKAKRDVEITEPRISYSAAQRNATQLVCAALQNDALSFGQAAKGKKLDMLVDFVEETTIRLAQLQMNAPAIMKEVNNDDE